jgi:hypothetical protein
MKALFIESSEFTEWVKEYLTDEALSALQRDLMSDPEIGAVMPGCGGLRKVRIADPSRGKGKRGGARVIYLHVPEANVIYFITVYGKDEKDDLSPGDKRLYRQLAAILKQQAHPDKEP